MNIHHFTPTHALIMLHDDMISRLFTRLGVYTYIFLHIFLLNSCKTPATVTTDRKVVDSNYKGVLLTTFADTFYLPAVPGSFTPAPGATARALLTQSRSVHSVADSLPMVPVAVRHGSLTTAASTSSHVSMKDSTATVQRPQPSSPPMSFSAPVIAFLAGLFVPVLGLLLLAALALLLRWSPH